MHRGKRSLRFGICKGDETGSIHPGQRENLFADLLLFMSGEGEEATSPSFATANALIEASSALLEALIPSSLPAGGIVK